jgi:hypothetical protein
MRFKIGPSLLAVALLGAAAVALFQRSGAAGTTREASVAPRPSETTPPGSEAFNTMMPSSGELETPLPPNHPAIGAKGAAPSTGGTALPPNHPAMGAQGNDLPAAREQAALAWTAPAGWEVAPSRSTIRLATYRVPGAAPAELTVTRAGGSTEDNLERWVGQFDNAGKDTRAVRTIAGFHVTTLEVSGTYDGGMSSTGPETAHAGWSLLGAVIETSGPFYFFKMVGPSEAVRAARPAFEALMNSVRKPS